MFLGSAGAQWCGLLQKDHLVTCFQLTMRVLVLSTATGEVVWDYTSGSFWQARGWELRMRPFAVHNIFL